jgi:nitrate/nitrite transporter NarK
VNDLMYAMIFISLAIGFAMSANASYYAVNIDLAKERAGTALGIMDAVFAIAGFLAPTITGFSISLTGHFEAAFYLMAVLALSSSFVTFFVHNKIT